MKHRTWFFLSIVILIVVISVVLSVVRKESKSNLFLKDCIEYSNEIKQSEKGKELCLSIEDKYFQADRNLSDFDLKQIGAPSLEVDKRVKFVLFEDKKRISSIAYCYFVFRKWFDPMTYSPSQLTTMASGFSILETELKGFDEWLLSNEGNSCQARVRDELKMEVVHPHELMDGKMALIALNPIASVGVAKNLDEVVRESVLTLNHERIHVIQIYCPELDLWAKKSWHNLTDAERQEVASRFPFYNWQDQTVAVREFLAHSFESEPNKILEHTKSCKY